MLFQHFCIEFSKGVVLPRTDPTGSFRVGDSLEGIANLYRLFLRICQIHLKDWRQTFI